MSSSYLARGGTQTCEVAPPMRGVNIHECHVEGELYRKEALWRRCSCGDRAEV